MTTLSDVDQALAVLQADPKAARSTKAFAAAAAGYLHTLAPTPAPVVTGGVGLYQLGGSLARCSHLTDGTYETVIGDWDDAPLLSKVSGTGFVYTVTAATTTDPGYVTLDAANPGAYVAKVRAWQTQHGFKGVFLDNTIASIPGLLDALKIVGPALRTYGIPFACNLGNYVPGNPGSDDGTLWMQWAQQAAPYLDYAMLENWQQVSDNGTPYAGKLRLRGEEWFNHFDGWQRCPGAVGSMRFMGCTYGPPAPGASTAGRVYGRAALLTAPGVRPDAVFVYSTPAADPYDPDWTKADPVPVVDSWMGQASL